MVRLNRRGLAVLLLVVAILVIVSVSAQAYNWWEDLPMCHAASGSHWSNPGLIAACIFEIMYDVMHGEGWDWT